MRQTFSKNSKYAVITLIGCGKMGSAMLEGWLKTYGQDVKFNVINRTNLDEKYPDKKFLSDPRVTYESDPVKIREQIARSTAVVFATKPNHPSDPPDNPVRSLTKEACDYWHEHDLMPPGVPVISTCAGIPTDFFKHYFGNDRTYVRTMPNTPARIGQGVTGVYFKNPENKKVVGLTQKLIAPFGKNFQVEEEGDMDFVTSHYGSAPAYVFYLAEYISKNLGMSESEVRQKLIERKKQYEKNGVLFPYSKSDEFLRICNRFQMVYKSLTNIPFTDDREDHIRQTILGAIAMMESAPDTSVETLRKNVTSYKGTTAAALEVMMADDFLKPYIFAKALVAAKDRSIELGQWAMGLLKAPKQTPLHSPEQML